MSDSLGTDDIAQVIEALGGLHDARLSGLRWDAAKRRLEVDIDDIYSNSEGLPGYQGPKAGTLAFHAVTRFDVDVPLGGPGLLVFDCTVRGGTAGSWETELAFSPGGRILVESESVELSAQ